jgi:diadenosine tetraphosphatase ApaH/serine/threonine PP2A family protein phosphatase
MPDRGADRRSVTGPFDVIGDVHACVDELADLFTALGYVPDVEAGWRSPEGRLPVFVGDFVDRGPSNAGVLRLAMRMVGAGSALAVPGNHDVQLERHLAGDPVPLVYGLAETVTELSREPDEFRREVLAFLQGLPGHLWLDHGRLVVAHTGLAEALHGDDSPRTRTLAAYGVADGEMDPSDPEKRHAWVRDYQGQAAVVYGHTSVAEPVWRQRTIDIDTGCVFGWRLTALRWPERTLVSVPARRRYVRSRRRFYPGA